MKRKRENANEAASAKQTEVPKPKEQQQEEEQLMTDMLSVEIKKEKIDDEEEEECGQRIEVDPVVDPLSAVKQESEDDCNINIEKVILPFHPNENFWDENQEFSTTEMTDEVSVHKQPKLEPFCGSLPKNIEFKIEIEEPWNYTPNAEMPDVSKLFLSFEENSTGNADENHPDKNALKRSKVQTSENKKKLCNESSSPKYVAPKNIPTTKHSSTCCSLQVNEDNDDETGEDTKDYSVYSSEYFVCHLCNITYTNIDLFSDHISENHKYYVYCTKCKFLIKTKNKLAVKKHESMCCKLLDINKYSNVGKAKQIILEKTWNKKDNYENLCEDFHASEHFICHLCNENYCSLQDINDHVAKQHKKYLYCVKCRFVIKIANKTALSNHEEQCCKFVTSKPLICCNYCMKFFANVTKMMKHVKIKHSDDKNFQINNLNSDSIYKLVPVLKCSFCCAVYQKEADVKAHMFQQHKNELSSNTKLVVCQKQIFIKCIYCHHCFLNLSSMYAHILSKHPNKSNITEINFVVNKSNANTNIVKLETCTQTYFEDFDLEYLEFKLKFKKMEEFVEQNENGPILSQEHQAIDTSVLKNDENSTDTQKNKIAKEKLVPILNTCNSFCTQAMNSAAVKKSGYYLAVHCTVCSQDILAELYFSRHLVLCVCHSNSVQCIFCSQHFAIVDKNIFAYLSHIILHFSDTKLRNASLCTYCKLSFFCSFNKTMHEQSKKCIEADTTTKIVCKTPNVTTTPSDSYCKETAKLLEVVSLACNHIKSELKNGQFLAIHCVSCNKNIGAFEYFNFHIKECLKETPRAACVLCKKHSASSVLDTLKNIVSHLGYEYYKSPCSFCLAVFFNSYNRDKHLETHDEYTSNPLQGQPSTSSSLLNNATPLSLPTDKTLSLPTAKSAYILPKNPEVPTPVDASSIHTQTAVGQGLRLILPKNLGTQSGIVLASSTVINPAVRVLFPPQPKVLPKNSNS